MIRFKRKCDCKVLHCEEVRLNHQFHDKFVRFPDIIKQADIFHLWCNYLNLNFDSDLKSTRIWIGHFDVVDMNVITLNDNENGNIIYVCQGLFPGVTKIMNGLLNFVEHYCDNHIHCM